MIDKELNQLLIEKGIDNIVYTFYKKTLVKCAIVSKEKLLTIGLLDNVEWVDTYSLVSLETIPQIELHSGDYIFEKSSEDIYLKKFIRSWDETN